MTDSSIAETPTFADALSPLERAALGLQDELSIWEIATATCPEQERARLTDFLLQAIKAGRLAAYGNPDGWDVQSAVDPPGAYEENPWRRCTPHAGTRTTREIRPGYRSRYADMSWHGDNCLVRRVDYLVLLATPEARGIPFPDWWKAPQSENTPAGSNDNLRLSENNYQLSPLPQGEPDKPDQVEKSRLSDKEILALRKQGLSNDFIHNQYGVPRYRITRVNKKYEVPQLNPGPKPKVSY